MTHLNEEVVIATFHRVGSKMKILDDRKLHQLFCTNKPFDQFRMHRHYGMCNKLAEVMTTLAHGGSINWVSPELRYFRITEHTLGNFGQKLYEAFSLEDRVVIDQVASQIKDLNIDYVEYYSDYRWIKVKRFKDDENLSMEERFHLLEEHHLKETQFLIEEVRSLADKIEKMR